MTMIDADKMKEVAERGIYKAAYKWGTVSGGTIEEVQCLGELIGVKRLALKLGLVDADRATDIEDEAECDEDI